MFPFFFVGRGGGKDRPLLGFSDENTFGFRRGIVEVTARKISQLVYSLASFFFREIRRQCVFNLFACVFVVCFRLIFPFNSACVGGFVFFFFQRVERMRTRRQAIQISEKRISWVGKVTLSIKPLRGKNKTFITQTLDYF